MQLALLHPMTPNKAYMCNMSNSTYVFRHAHVHVSAAACVCWQGRSVSSCILFSNEPDDVQSGAVIDAQEGKQSISKDGTKSAFAAEAEPASSHSQTDTATVSSSTPEANKGISSSDSSRTAATAQAEPGTSILPLPAAAVAAPSPPSIQSNVKKTSPSTVSSEVSRSHAYTRCHVAALRITSMPYNQCFAGCLSHAGFSVCMIRPYASFSLPSL